MRDRDRRGAPGHASRAAPYDDFDSDSHWPHDRYHDDGNNGTHRQQPRQQAGSQQGGGSQGTVKVHVDNLDYGVSQADLQELFGSFGDLDRVFLRGGGGSAIVYFFTHSAASAAVREYNGRTLDGREMKLSIAGGDGARGGGSGGGGGRGGSVFDRMSGRQHESAGLQVSVDQSGRRVVPHDNRAPPPQRQERAPRPPRAQREPRAPREPREQRPPREPRESREAKTAAKPEDLDAELDAYWQQKGGE